MNAHELRELSYSHRWGHLKNEDVIERILDHLTEGADEAELKAEEDRENKDDE